MLSLVWWGKASGMDGEWSKAVAEATLALRCMPETPHMTPGVVDERDESGDVKQTKRRHTGVGDKGSPGKKRARNT